MNVEKTPLFRRLVDRLCTGATDRLRPGGSPWVVHSALACPQRTPDMLAEHGLDAHVAGRADPFGPVLSKRSSWPRRQGMLAPDQNTEVLVVISARKLFVPAAPSNSPRGDRSDAESSRSVLR